MSKYFKRAFGNYDPVDKLVSIELDQLDVKKSPKCQACVIEVLRGDKNLRSDEIPCGSSAVWPHKINNVIAMASVFY